MQVDSQEQIINLLIHSFGQVGHRHDRKSSQKLNQNRWVSEKTWLIVVVYCYNKMDYVDNDFVSSLEKYVKVRCIQIEDANLVAAICEYCMDLKVRRPQILNGVSE